MFDLAYRGLAPETGYADRPPWSIGEPQPELAALADAGAFRGEILDAGCGEAALALTLAGRGFTTVGLDQSSTAIRLAREAAARGGLTKATFEVADITNFGGYDARFGTIVDSTLFHSIPVARRLDYQRCIARAAAPGASYFVLTFDGNSVPRGLIHPVGMQELYDVISPYWTVDEIKHARIYAEVPDGFAQFWKFAGPDVLVLDDKRVSIPGWLLSAHCH